MPKGLGSLPHRASAEQWAISLLLWNLLEPLGHSCDPTSHISASPLKLKLKKYQRPVSLMTATDVLVVDGNMGFSILCLRRQVWLEFRV